MEDSSKNINILWFANTPCSATERLRTGYYAGGWLSSLEKQLSESDEINLNVVFYHNVKLDPFKHNKTLFFPIFRETKRSKFSRLMHRLFTRRLKDTSEIPLLLDVINKVKPDLIHIHGTEENFGMIQRYVKIPVVISLQGIMNPYLKMFYAGIPRNVSNKYLSFKDRVIGKSFSKVYKDYLFRAKREQEILSDSKFIIGRTKWDKRVTNVLAPKAKYYIGQELLRDEFYQNKWDKIGLERKIKLVTVTSGALYKGIETIFRTAYILKNTSQLDFEWNIIGINRSSPVLKIILNWFRCSLLDLNINVLGRKNASEMIKEMINSDIFCFVSHIENSPNSLCEAMILGMPVISTNCGGISSLLRDGEEGILVQSGDSYSFAGAIIELINNQENQVLFSAEARKTALKRHQIQTVKEEYLNIYRDIINKYEKVFD